MRRTKIIQELTAWRYPHSGNLFEFVTYNDTLALQYNPYKFRQYCYQESCSCGKSCKPQKIRIIVEVAE